MRGLATGAGAAARAPSRGGAPADEAEGAERAGATLALEHRLVLHRLAQAHAARLLLVIRPRSSGRLPAATSDRRRRPRWRSPARGARGPSRRRRARCPRRSIARPGTGSGGSAGGARRGAQLRHELAPLAERPGQQLGQVDPASGHRRRQQQRRRRSSPRRSSARRPPPSRRGSARAPTRSAGRRPASSARPGTKYSSSSSAPGSAPAVDDRDDVDDPVGEAAPVQRLHVREQADRAP